jgi:hypothetical protein
MFFSPKLPISDKERDWADASFEMLIGLFGRERLGSIGGRGAAASGPGKSVVVLPSLDFFAREWEPTEAWALFAVDQVCEMIGADRRRVDVRFFEVESADDALRQSLPHWESSGSKGPAGTYGELEAPESSVDVIRARISLNASQLQDPTQLIATIAHELAHLLLLGDRKIDRDIPDMEPLTDLMTVFCGFGVFNANSAFNFRQWQSDTGRGGWQTNRLGYLPEPMWGYALARYAFLLDDPRPPWSGSLKLNVRSYMKQSMKVLVHQARRR